MRRAKIVCTLGPSSATSDVLQVMATAGMDVARLNMSHGSHDEKAAHLTALRAAATGAGKSITVFIDLQGPKIRLGTFAAGPVTLVNGAQFTITTVAVAGDSEVCSTTYTGLPGDVQVGDQILVADGTVVLEATAVTATDVVCRVIQGGPISDHKGINLPGVAVNVPALSDKDAADLRWGLTQDIDLVALSFVRSAADIEPVHAIMDEVGRRLPVIAKIEKPQALEHLDAIAASFDALMVARGDLGVELPFEAVPMAQKRIIAAARKAAKPVIVATQMLESMVASPRPTRAEASDVAHAILDGADAVMLSDETAAGDFPVEAVAAMRRIVEMIEDDGFDEIDRIHWDPHTTSGVVPWGAAMIARQVQAKYLVSFTDTGDTTRRLARLRGHIPILSFTPRQATAGQLGIVWGARTFVTANHDLPAMVAEVDAALVRDGLCTTGDVVVLVYGVPMGTSGQTNTVQVHEVGATV